MDPIGIPSKNHFQTKCSKCKLIFRPNEWKPEYSHPHHQPPTFQNTHSLVNQGVFRSLSLPHENMANFALTKGCVSKPLFYSHPYGEKYHSSILFHICQNKYLIYLSTQKNRDFFINKTSLQTSFTSKPLFSSYIFYSCFTC